MAGQNDQSVGRLLGQKMVDEIDYFVFLCLTIFLVKNFTTPIVCGIAKCNYSKAHGHSILIPEPSPFRGGTSYLDLFHPHMSGHWNCIVAK
jgi:hypothetical protein